MFEREYKTIFALGRRDAERGDGNRKGVVM